MLTKTKKGFTLIELLVSMTITLVIVGLLLGMTKIAVGAWQTTNAKTKSSRLAQEVFDNVGRDMEGIVIRTGNDFEWVNIVSSSLSSSELGPDGEKEIANALDVSFFTATPDRYNGQINTDSDQGGDVSLVRYRLIYQDVIDRSSGDSPVYSLYRERIEPNQAFEDLLAQPDLSGALPSGDSINEERNLLAENVYDFTLSFNFEYNIDNRKGYKRVVMQSEGTNNELSIRGDSILVNGAEIDSILPNGATTLRLSSADISVFVLSDRGMRELRNSPISGESAFSAFLKEHGTFYTKSVILPQP